MVQYCTVRLGIAITVCMYIPPYEQLRKIAINFKLKKFLLERKLTIAIAAIYLHTYK